MRPLTLFTVIFCTLSVGGHQAHAQQHDSPLNGAIIGAAVGAGAGVAFTYATRDSDLTVGQYAQGALVFGAIGAGAGLGIDALIRRDLDRRGVPSKVLIAPSVWRELRGVLISWRW